MRGGRWGYPFDMNMIIACLRHLGGAFLLLLCAFYWSLGAFLLGIIVPSLAIMSLIILAYYVFTGHELIVYTPFNDYTAWPFYWSGEHTVVLGYWGQTICGTYLALLLGLWIVFCVLALGARSPRCDRCK